MKSYVLSFRVLHWVMALMIIFMLTFGFFLEDLPKTMQPLAYMLHKSTGLTILLLMVIRFFWIHVSGKPALPATVANWQKFVARSVQYLLYLFVIVMTMAGWTMSVAAGRVPQFFGLFPVNFPGIVPNEVLSKELLEVHEISAYILIALISLHVLGALKHHFIDKDNVLRRMWSGE